MTAVFAHRVKRAPFRRPVLKTDVYVSRKSSFPALVKRCLKLCDNSDIQSFQIHGLGAAIVRAVEVALEVKKARPDVSLVTTTSTETLVDDVVTLESESAEQNLSSEQRLCSSIHIQVIIKQASVSL